MPLTKAKLCGEVVSHLGFSSGSEHIIHTSNVPVDCGFSPENGHLWCVSQAYLSR